jgi:hypothetical protein
MTIDASGNLGIGTESPTEPLTIRSPGENINTVLLAIGNDVHATNTKDAWIRFEAGTGGSADQTFAIGPSNNSFRFVHLGTRATAPHSGTELMRIASAGQIGIGGANYGTDGQVLTSTGANSAPAWEAAGGGATEIGGLTDGTTSGTRNLGLGSNAVNSITSASDNIGIGLDALTALTEGNENVAVGGYAMAALTTGEDNTALGKNALGATTTGNRLIAIGYKALQANTTAEDNTAVGTYALTANTTGYQNTAVGVNSLVANTTANNNTAIGYNSLDVNTTGATNVAVGAHSLGANTTASNNTAVGGSSLKSNTTGADNVAVGGNALFANTTGSSNVAIGYLTLDASTTASHNTAVGQGAMTTTTTGSFCTAVGKEALSAHTSGADNNAFGYNALGALTTGTNNTAMGNSALAALTTTAGNTAFGKVALSSSVTGSYNSALGYQALQSCLDGGFNVGLGWQALYANTSGGSNVAIGKQAGDNITSGSSNIVIGADIDVPTATASGQINIGNAFKMASNGDIELKPNGEVQNTFNYNAARNLKLYGDANSWMVSMWVGSSSGAQYYFDFRNLNNTQVGYIGSNSSNVSYNTSSDYRLKENVTYTWDATSRLKQLKPARFNWIADETNTLQDGFLAHEVDAIVPVAVDGEKDAMESEVLYIESDHETITTYYKVSDQEVIDGTKNAGDIKVAATKSVGDVKYPEQIKSQVIDHSKLVPLLVKTIQELEARITTLENA